MGRDLQPGRELDALIAEHVMGFRREKAPKDYYGEHGGTDVLVPLDVDHQNWHYPPKGRIPLTFFVPDYSTELTAAWQVWEKMRTWRTPSPMPAVVALKTPAESGAAFVCAVMTDSMYYGHADTAPHAICLAALEAVGYKEG